MYYVLTSGVRLTDSGTVADLIFNTTDVDIESNGTSVDSETNATKFIFSTHVKENAGQIKFWFKLLYLIRKDNLTINWSTKDGTASECYNVYCNIHGYTPATNYELFIV